MSKTTIALEAQVATVIANRAESGVRPSARQRHEIDKAFAAILKLIAPRIRHFIRQYGLVAHWEDAEQCCAIAVHRAIEAYEPEKAQFTTFVNWQIRGELQSLRFRLMTDQRSSAKKVEATTISINSVVSGPDGEENGIEAIIEDEDALERVEASASAYLAGGAIQALVDEYIADLRQQGIEQLKKRPRPKRAFVEQQIDVAAQLPARPQPRFRGVDPAEMAQLEEKLARNREIVEQRVFSAATLDEMSAGTCLTKERVRQITKRATKSMTELAANHPRFRVMAGDTPSIAADLPKKPTVGAASRVAKATLLPETHQAHNNLTRMVEIPAATAQHDGGSFDALDVSAIAPENGAGHVRH